MNAPVRVDAGTPLTIWRGLAVGGLDVEVATERPLPAPGYAGGALRGLLGRALARQVCPLPTPECGGCGLRVGCAYALAFKPATLPGAGAVLPGYLPHGWQVRTGSRVLRLRLRLFGPGLALAGTFAQALVTAAPALDWAGGGAGQVLALRDAGSGQPYRAGAPLTPLPWPVLPAAAAQVRLLTPLSTKHGGADPLWPALRTRLQRLVKLYGDGSVLVDPSAPAPWRLVSARLRPEALARGGAHERLARGWRGGLTLADLTPPGRELLAAGLLLHAGADTSLGFGRYRLLPDDAPAAGTASA